MASTKDMDIDALRADSQCARRWRKSVRFPTIAREWRREPPVRLRNRRAALDGSKEASFHDVEREIEEKPVPAGNHSFQHRLIGFSFLCAGVVSTGFMTGLITRLWVSCAAS